MASYLMSQSDGRAVYVESAKTLGTTLPVMTSAARVSEMISPPGARLVGDDDDAIPLRGEELRQGTVDALGARRVDGDRARGAVDLEDRVAPSGDPRSGR